MPRVGSIEEGEKWCKGRERGQQSSCLGAAPVHGMSQQPPGPCPASNHAPQPPAAAAAGGRSVGRGASPALEGLNSAGGGSSRKLVSISKPPYLLGRGRRKLASLLCGIILAF